MPATMPHSPRVMPPVVRVSMAPRYGSRPTGNATAGAERGAGQTELLGQGAPRLGGSAIQNPRGL
jgi:hypothetical protein